MKVLVTGATGLIGKEIVKILHAKGITIHFLTTAPEKIKSKPNTKGYYWNPKTGEIDENCLAGVDAVIHLAGASIAKRWTKKYKQEIVESRVLSANLLFQLLKTHPHQVKQIVSASAIGVYPSSFTSNYNEEFNKFEDTFLANVVLKWEGSVQQFSRLGLNVCKLRIGLVLSKKGGALPQLVKPVRFGLGSVFGSGKQWQSWIHVKDLARMFVFSLENNSDGIFNAVAPNPVTHREMMFSIARILKKPLFFPNTPRVIMKLLLGEMHTLLFESQKVSSAKIQENGFHFQFLSAEEALTDLLKKKINV
ncbi:TIGR01777 family oxidoreductase [Flavobacterium sp. H122]|uniref:TIGR01777 family oxidoreductase n=1 Tax=Flavobacterium sp. H122 TaxID=2529860 RepID=UPI0010A9F9BC|nr:TIGR01777 family oxidoreductase [Flavobacterium sp. H122]